MALNGPFSHPVTGHFYRTGLKGTWWLRKFGDSNPGILSGLCAVERPATGGRPVSTFALVEAPSLGQHALTSLEDAFGIGFTVGKGGGRRLQMTRSSAETESQRSRAWARRRFSVCRASALSLVPEALVTWPDWWPPSRGRQEFASRDVSGFLGPDGAGKLATIRLPLRLIGSSLRAVRGCSTWSRWLNRV